MGVGGLREILTFSHKGEGVSRTFSRKQLVLVKLVKGERKSQIKIDLDRVRFSHLGGGGSQ